MSVLGVLRLRLTELAPTRVAWPTLLAAASVLLVLLSVTRFAGPNHTLEPMYTDHLQHEYSAWAFLHIGFRIFALPKSDWGDLHARHVHLFWTTLPTIYPLGLVLFFMPFSVLSNEGWLSDGHAITLNVMALGVAAVLASFQLHRTLRLSYEPVLAAILTFFGATLFVTWGLDGFIDPLAAGLALLAIYWVRRGAPGRGLVVLALALWLQYRLWYLWPLAFAVAIQRRREIRPWQLACAAAIGLVSAFTFGLSVASVGSLRQDPGVLHNALAISHGLSGVEAVALVAGLLVIGVTYVHDGLVAAACVALAVGLILFVDDWAGWYPVLLVPLLAVVKSRPAQIAVVLVYVQAVAFLGGMPNFLHDAQLYIDAVR